MANEIETLIEMGFTRTKAERALAVTNNKGVEPAMEWLLAHSQDEEPTSAPSVAAGSAPPTETAEPVDPDEDLNAKSLKCEDCGKLFKSLEEAEFHGVKSGHANFSESTEEKRPLTEEERKEQLAKLEEKMKQKRKEREEKEKCELLEKERMRIRSGKDMQDAKQRMQEQEMQKLVEQRRRDKIEDQRAKDRVRQQILADKEARRVASQGGKPEDVPAPKIEPAPVPPSVITSPGKPSPTTARLQLRLPDGRAVNQNFGAKEQLSAVRLYLRLHDMKDMAFNLMTTFPKRVFNEDDYEKPLEVLGLVPSAVIIVSKLQQ